MRQVRHILMLIGLSLAQLHSIAQETPSAPTGALAGCPAFGLPAEVPFQATTPFTPKDPAKLKGCVGYARYGTIALTADKKHFTYTPKALFTGTDEVWFAAKNKPKVQLCRGTVNVVERYTRPGQIIIWHRVDDNVFRLYTGGEYQTIIRRTNCDHTGNELQGRSTVHWANQGGQAGPNSVMDYDNMPTLQDAQDAFVVPPAVQKYVDIKLEGPPHGNDPGDFDKGHWRVSSSNVRMVALTAKGFESQGQVVPCDHAAADKALRELGLNQSDGPINVAPNW